MTANVESSWIQAGELGLAFAVVVLAAWLVVYVMQTSKAREQQLMELLLKIQPAMTELVDKISHMDNRLAEIETALSKSGRIAKKPKKVVQ